jgi:UDP-N-acetylglucosamine 2-epimerase
MPEEINRRLTGHLATWHYCATRAAVDNLAREGVTRGVVCAGDVMADAVAAFAPCAVFPPPPLAGWGLRRRGYAVLTCHRAGNTDDAARLGAILEGAARVGRALPVVFPVHPRTRARLGPTDPPAPGVRACGPLSYLEMLGLTRAAALVLTDSGGLQKEAYLLGTPCLTLREETEWTETVATGWNRLVGANAEAIAEGARLALAERPNARPELFGDGRAAERIAAHLARALAGGADRAKEPAEPGPSPR